MDFWEIRVSRKEKRCIDGRWDPKRVVCKKHDGLKWENRNEDKKRGISRDSGMQGSE